MRVSLLVLLAVVCTAKAQRECSRINGARVECVSVRECPSVLGALQVRPLLPEVANYLRLLQCGFDGFTPKVCCPPELDLNQSNRPSTKPSRPTTTRRPSSNRPLNPTRANLLATYDECGADTTADRIYNGEITEIDEFPWMALLGYRRKNGTIAYLCGGSLINKRYILTAAHCVTGAINTEIGPLVSVRLGEYHTKTNPDCIVTSAGDDDCNDPLQEINVEEIIPHSGYIDGHIDRNDDIALVRLSKEVTTNYFVSPVCIANATLRVTPGDDVYVAGWGKTESGRNSDVKLKLKMPFFDHGECVQKFLTTNAKLSNKQICAGGEYYKDSCNGDSGGPLMQHVADRWYAIGVVSFGRACGLDGWPGVYTSTTSYKDWILRNMRP